MAINPGQKKLIQDHVLPQVERYFHENKYPDRRSFMDHMEKQHPAIADALGVLLDQAYTNGIKAYKGKFMQLVDREIADAQKALMADQGAGQQGKFGQAGAEGGYIGNPGSHDYRASGALRQLSMSQAADASGESWPFWYKEQDRLQRLSLTGKITNSEWQSQVDRLYKETYSNPNTQQAPPGWDFPHSDKNKWTSFEI